MPLMNWEPKFSVKVEKFDKDHQHLFQIVNDLNDAMRAGKGKVTLENVLTGLVSYTQKHFASEEAEMRRSGYTDLANHIREHQKLTKKVQDFMEEYKKGNSLVSIELLMFLREWLEKHIQVTDQKYSPHMNSHGIS